MPSSQSGQRFHSRGVPWRLSSITANRNSTITAPAYTSTWIAATNWASSNTNIPASANMQETSHITDAIGLVRVTTSRAEITAQAAKHQNTAK
jgi:hypothetical protein